MTEDKMLRLRREVNETKRLRSERVVREQIADSLASMARLLRECHMYRGYTDGPARLPAVREAYGRAFALLDELDRSKT
jgi:hypothetical protein